MSYEQFKFENTPSKEDLWERQQREIEHTADTLGYGIDEQIKETVIAFNVIGLTTQASCGGHSDRAIPAPWVEIGAPNQPDERFVGEIEVFQKVADRYGVPLEDVRRAINYDAYREAVKKVGPDETPEYKEWRERTKILMDKAASLLEEFYQDRNVPPSVRLKILEGGEGDFRIQNGGEDFRPVPEGLTDTQIKELAQRLAQYQNEMKEFTAFLKDKYFSE